MKKVNNYILFGALINLLWIFSKRFFQLPEFINGFLLGLAIVLMILGSYIENHDINKLKNYKRKIIIKLRDR